MNAQLRKDAFVIRAHHTSKTLVRQRLSRDIADLVGEHSNLDVAIELVEAGFVVFPARADDKRPHVKDWANVATDDPEQVRRWWRKWPDAMPGLPTGMPNGVAVLDIDQKKGKDGAASLRALGFDPDDLSPVSVTTPTGGRHLYFMYGRTLGCSTDNPGPGVDVRAGGGFVIAPGSKNADGGAYGRFDVCPESAYDRMPDWPDDLVPIRQVAKKGDGEKLDISPAELEEVLFTIPNTDANPDAESRDWWLNNIAAIHHQTDGEGFTLAEDWSAQHHSHDLRHLRNTWRSLGRNRGVPITARHILAEARKHGWRDDAELHRLFEELDADPDYGEVDEGGRVRKSRLTFLSPGDCANCTARRYVVKGLLAEGDVAAVVGAPGVGKSLLAPRLGYAVAQGEPIFGLRTRQGGVLYVAAEDESGMRSRVTALYRDHGAADDFTLVGGVSSLFPDSPDLRELRKVVKEQRPSLVVIDTLAIAFPGLEENSAEGMGRVVAAARSLTKWGAAVILVHHDTKDGSNGLPRGHSLLNGALDMSLHLTRDDDLVVAKPTKNRNGSSDVRFGFGIGTRVLGVDEDGDEITTAICEERGEMPPERREDRIRPSAQAALDVLEEMAEGRNGVPEAEWREACLEVGKVSGAEDRDARRRVFSRALADLVEKAKVENENGKFFLAGSVRASDFGEIDHEFV